MTTRRKFTGAVLAAGAMANFALVAAPNAPGSNGNPCNGHGKADQCHGNGNKSDNVQPPEPPAPGCQSSARMGRDNTPPPSCTSAKGQEDHVE